MKVLLIGYGKMGKLIEKFAPEYGIEIAKIIEKNDTINKRDLSHINVAIDFSSPAGISSRVEKLLDHQIPICIGTTGWDEEVEEVKALVKQYKGAILAASNFSLGVALFFKLVRSAAKILSLHEQYDVAIQERHHRQKKDAPSGTAKQLGRILLSELKHKKEVTTSLTLPPEPTQLHISSVRVGHIPGEHEIIFDGPDDTIQLAHKARTRNDFARGALLAAKWIQGKKGFFTIEDML